MELTPQVVEIGAIVLILLFGVYVVFCMGTFNRDK